MRVKSDNLPIVPHSDVGDKECCGCLIAVERGDQTDLICNECGALVRTVPTAEVQQTLLRMALAQGICSAICPHCGALNTFPGFAFVEAYICCSECGEGVSVETPIQ